MGNTGRLSAVNEEIFAIHDFEIVLEKSRARTGGFLGASRA
jgi:hypothetical protein